MCSSALADTACRDSKRSPIPVECFVCYLLINKPITYWWPQIKSDRQQQYVEKSKTIAMGDPVQSETLWTRFSLLQQIGRYCIPIFTSAPLLSTKWTFNIPMEGIEKPHDDSGQHSSQTQLRPSVCLSVIASNRPNKFPPGILPIRFTPSQLNVELKRTSWIPHGQKNTVLLVIALKDAQQMAK